VEESLLNKFYDQLVGSWSKTLSQFFMLQLIGSNNRKEVMKQLHEAFITKTPPKIKSLKSALEILKKTDLTKTISNIKVPTVIIAGDCDRLTPIGASIFMQSKIKNSRLKIFKSAGHIPFLSHPKDFIKEVLLSFNHK
jgi:pimeloyl-[acyl-carrier protein] methyl ester esterase